MTTSIAMNSLDAQFEELILERNNFEKEVIRLTKENESLKQQVNDYAKTRRNDSRKDI